MIDQGRIPPPPLGKGGKEGLAAHGDGGMIFLAPLVKGGRGDSVE
jgi:hypothetical protein